MLQEPLIPLKSLNKAYRRQKVNRTDIEKFRDNLSFLLKSTLEAEIDQLVYELMGLWKRRLGSWKVT